MRATLFLFIELKLLKSIELDSSRVLIIMCCHNITKKAKFGRLDSFQVT